ncbi:hypothetical protein ACGFIV_29815 [Sphaerisporangium sp. NPDC049003]|uniref:hypothetical protein n=1 Tax=Sphaerisporangium sp. NPDC049003 TaxID=3364517 RepID=UPI003717421D
MGDDSYARGWPFLVARGRHRGYRTLLAPGFLIAEHGHGVLDDSVVPNSDQDRATVIEVETGRGRRLTVAHATHLVTSADIAEPGAPPDPRDPRDQHSRPLQLIYGYVCLDAAAGEPDQEDLRFCRQASLGAYRRFLGDEEGFTVEASEDFPLRSPVTRRPSAPARRPARMSPMDGYDDSVRPPVRWGRALVAAGVVLVAVVLAIVWLTPRPEPRVECDRADQQTVSEPGPPSASPTVTCLREVRQKVRRPEGP